MRETLLPTLLSVLFVAKATLAGDLDDGDVVISGCGDNETGFILTHVDTTSGEQYPLTTTGVTQVVGLPGGPFAVAGDYELTRVDPATGAHRLVGGTELFSGFPRDVEADAAGNLYYTLGAAVTKVEAATDLIEVLTSGGDLIEPTGLVIEAGGNVFIADPEAGRVFRFNENEGTSVFASGGMLDRPRRVQLLPDGDLLVADGAQLIRLARSNAAQSIWATMPVDTGIDDLFADSEGDVFVLLGGDEDGFCDAQNDRDSINRVQEGVGVVETLLCQDDNDDPIGSFRGLDGNDGELFLVAAVPDPSGDPSAGAPEAVASIDQLTAALEVRAVRAPSGPFAFSSDGTLYVARIYQTTDIRRVDPTTGIATIIASGGLLGFPRGIAVAGDPARIYTLNQARGVLNIIRINPVTGSQTEFIAPTSELSGGRVLRNGRDGHLFAVTNAGIVHIDLGTRDLTVRFDGNYPDAADLGGGSYYALDGLRSDIVLLNGGETPIGGDDFLGFQADVSGILLEDDGNLLVNHTGGFPPPPWLIDRIDPGIPSRSQLSELSLCRGTLMKYAVVPEPSGLLCSAASLGCLALLRAGRRHTARP